MERRDAMDVIEAEYLDGMTKAEQVDALEDLAGELQQRAEDLRAEMRAAAEAGEEES